MDYKHEMRDTVHVFIGLDDQEREVVDSLPFQRLRHIHQLATTYLVYPGATHTRFEHSLGVMELATRIFDTITAPYNLTDEIRQRMSEITDERRKQYWRSVLRMAALCHDLGHLPFSHAAEKELLPEGWSHERIGVELINSEKMKEVWGYQKPPLEPQDIAKLAVGPEKMPEEEFSDWETLLSEIIVGDTFGADRMDYLLRDSYHAGVVYGKFDHHRLIDNLRILREPEGDHFTLGVDEGGLHCCEALLLARYFMYSQVYFHPVRRIYDIHLKEFLKEWLKHIHKRDFFPVEDMDEFLRITDVEVLQALRKAYEDKNQTGHTHAVRILGRRHFKVLYTRNPDDIKKNPDAVQRIYEAACNEFGEENVRVDEYTEEKGTFDFPVRKRDGRIVSSLAESQVLQNLPVATVGYVFVNREHYEKAVKWLREKRETILEQGI